MSACVASFLLHRYFFRPWVLDNIETGFLVIVANSYPNFLEGVIGTIILGGLGLWYKNRNGNWSSEHETPAFFNWVTIVAAAYVITQELNWYAITRENISDPYDIVASILGLVLINRILNSVGLLAYSNDVK